jgi:hypothetical protein
VHAPRFDFGRQRILVLVDHVLVDREVHDLVDLRLFPSLAEGREILACVAVKKQFVLNHLEHVRGKAFPIGKLVFRHRLGEVPACEDRIHERIADVISIG